MHNPNAKKEISSLLIFVPIMLLGVYLIYLAVAIPFQMGREVGLSQAPFREPVTEDTGDEVFDHRRLIQPNDELIAVGARIYNQQCASCHGASGQGDGPAGQNLAVKPRSFHNLDGWKIGPTILQMYESLEVGVGGNMPAFNQLNPRQKYAVIHYIQDEFMSGLDVPEDSPDAIAALPEPSGAETITIDSYANPRIPVTMAIENLARRAGEKPQIERTSRESTMYGLGRTLYLANCASCHGEHGQGVTPSRLNRSSFSQLRQLSQGPALLKVDAPWASDYSNFRMIVTEGIPDGVKPGHPTLTNDELSALYEYTLSLR